MTEGQRPPVRTGAVALPALVVVAGFATFSVVRYDLRIVAAYGCGAVLLAAALVLQRTRPPFGRTAVALGLACCAVATWAVPGFSYLTPGRSELLRGVVAGCTGLAAVLVALPRRRAADAALAVCAGGYLAVAAAVIRLDPAPRIDVWYTVQGAADALLAGRNPYTQVWVGPPSAMTAYTYLPWTGVLLAPGRWLLGDVRWSLVGLTLLAALAIRAVPGRSAGPTARAASAGLAAALLVLPGTTTQVEQAWTEPLLLACLAGFALAVRRGRLGLAVALLALGCASKQHLVLMLPVLAAWPTFGPRRAASTALLTGALVAPWVIADPAAILHDTVGFLIAFPPIRFADTLYLAARYELGWTPPFWLTGAVVATTLGLVALAVRRRDPDVGEVLRWTALLLLVANLVNKQAFYNQYWLVGAMLLLSWAVPASSVGQVSSPRALPAAAATGSPSGPSPIPG